MKMEINISDESHDITSKPIDLFDTIYYKFNKMLLSVYGQWPYQSSRERKLRAYSIILYTFTVAYPQIRTIIQSMDSFDHFAPCFSPFGTYFVALVKVVFFMSQHDKIEKVLDDTRANWQSMKDPAERSILANYGLKGRYWSMTWFILVYGIVTFWLVLAVSPKLLDIFIPLNESRKTFDVIPADYGRLVDQDANWWWVQLHLWSCPLLFFIAMLGIDGFYMICAQHICAMFEIIRYNLENMINEDEDVDVLLNSKVHENIYYHKVVSCIKQHKSLVEYINNLASSNESCLLLIVGLNMIGVSITGYQAVSEGIETDEAVRFALFTFAMMFHLFVITLPGHWIMQASEVFPNSVYSCRWYMTSLRTRRLIILTIRASNKPCIITAGKIYAMSIENFCGVLRTSMSYLTMLTSMQ